MKFFFIFGPPAVGKMTVGHELEKITDFKLFHNHMTIDLAKQFFAWENPSFGKLVNELRMTFFRCIAKSDLPGLIFTGAINFDGADGLTFVEEVEKIFQDAGHEVYYIELETSLGVRLERNKSLHRLEHKPTKRDTAASEAKLLDLESSHRFNSHPGEFKKANYIKIDNTYLSAEDTALKIKKSFLGI